MAQMGFNFLGRKFPESPPDFPSNPIEHIQLSFGQIMAPMGFEPMYWA